MSTVACILIFAATAFIFYKRTSDNAAQHGPWLTQRRRDGMGVVPNSTTGMKWWTLTGQTQPASRRLTQPHHRLENTKYAEQKQPLGDCCIVA